MRGQIVYAIEIREAGNFGGARQPLRLLDPLRDRNND